VSAERNLVLYDGLCGLCDRTVQWLLQHDRRGALVFAPLQGETARPYLDVTKQTGSPDGFDTIVFVERDQRGTDRVHVRSRAAFRILRLVGAPWSWLAVFSLLPAFLTDAGYRFIARRRLRWFGQLDACRLPDAKTRARFLP
jgi:predicted DCC family thiol-disulfide oxidoreductase YuxK